VIHARHSSVSIYYCRFPNQYLSEISQYGNSFLAKRTFTDKVKLFRTNKYSLRDTTERVELFRFLTKLLWYLVSGESKVGYLSNYPDNPLHYLVIPDSQWAYFQGGKVVYDTIAVEDDPLPSVTTNDNTAILPEDEGNTTNNSFSASETGGEAAEVGGLDSAGEDEDKTEGEPMDWA
jgi:hypothetical protein